MLKACWDCLAGDQRQNEESHQIHLNGAGRRVSHWQNNVVMFECPTPALRGENEIGIDCLLNEDNRLNVVIIGTDENILCEIRAVKSPDATEDRILLFDSEGSSQEVEHRTSQIFTDRDDENPTHNIRIILKRNNYVNIYANAVYLNKVLLGDDTITKVLVVGEVKQISFKF